MSTSIFDRVGVRGVYERLTGRTVEAPSHLRRARVRCPSSTHQDVEASCDLDITKNIWKCRTCPAGGGVADMVIVARKARDHAEAARWLEGHLDAPRAGSTGGGRVVAEYEYRDESGKLLYVVERRKPKRFVQKVPDNYGGFRFKLNGVRRVPYRLPELREGIARGKTSFCPEGEKDTDALAKLDLCATTSAQGASWKWPMASAKFFADAAQVVFIADCDEPGRKAALQRASVVAKVCSDVRVLDLAPARSDGYDVSDYFAEGHTVDELRALADEAPRVEAAFATEAVAADDGARELLTTCASDVHAKRVEWFEPERIPFGGLTLFDGPGGVGKTTANLGILAAASVGRFFFDGSPRDPITSIVVAEEDSFGHLKLKLRLAGADLSRIQFVTGVRVADGVEPFALPIHVAELERTIEKTGACFVYVDALFSHLLLEGDGRMPQQVRRALRPLVEMVARTGVAFAATRHWTKATGPASARALGSAELGNIARSVLSFARHPDDESRGVIAVTKHNLAQRAPTLVYRIEALTMADDDGNLCEVTKVTLDGEAPDVTADDIAMQLPGDPDERGAAQDWLADFLGDGEWHGAAEVYKAARKDGAGAPATVRRAANRLRVEKDRSGFPSRSRWRLHADCAQDARSQSVSKLEQTAERTAQTFATTDAAQSICPFFIGNPGEPCCRCSASFAEHYNAVRP